MYSPRVVARLDPLIRQTAYDKATEIAPPGKCEFAMAIAAATFCGLLGLPAEEFERFNKDVLCLGLRGRASADLSRREAAAAELRARVKTEIATIISDLIPHRRSNPGEDIISFRLAAEVNGRPLTDDEILDVGSLKFFAGTDSTGSIIAYCAAFLGSHPGHRK